MGVEKFRRKLLVQGTKVPDDLVLPDDVLRDGDLADAVAALGLISALTEIGTPEEATAPDVAAKVNEIIAALKNDSGE